MITLENEFLVVKAKFEGAELISIVSKKDNMEYLWQGDTKYSTALLCPLKIFHILQYGLRLKVLLLFV